MKLDGSRIILTGAAGGIGSELTTQLYARGASLGVVGRSDDELVSLRGRLSGGAGTVHGAAADLLDPGARGKALGELQEALGGVDILINCAGLLSFRPIVEEDPAVLERIIQLNLVTPVLLARQLLPAMLERGHGHIVNVGSTFGSIGFAWFSAYSASKFGLRGFSESLRRELEGTGVAVTYVAPRAVKTNLNTGAVYRMAEATGMNMDDPAWVASRIVAAIDSDAKDVYLGFPEKFFAWLNGFLPRVVDSGLRKQNRTMESFARGT